MSIAIEKCRICGNSELVPLIDLGVQAHTGLFPSTKGQDVTEGELELVKCQGEYACGLVQLKHSWAPEELYGVHYGYRSGLNPSMVRHLQGIAQLASTRVDLLPGDIVLDIGSNDGTLLTAFCSHGVAPVGMDPTAGKFRQYYPPQATVLCSLFSSAKFLKECGGKKAKLVTSIAMFYDLESPLQFMHEIAEVLADDGVWIFEQSYLPTMIAMDSYDTICHEHLEYYALTQIKFMADRAGLTLLDVSFNQSNGGSFRVVAGHTKKSVKVNGLVAETLSRELADGYNGLEVYRRFRDRIEQRREELTSYLERAHRDGQKVFGYGASTKGNVILQYCGITERELPLIAEVNPDKFGAYTPKTLIPIVPEADARALSPDAFLVLPWHFRDYIVAKENAFLEGGGHLVFPLPRVEVVRHSSDPRMP